MLKHHLLFPQPSKQHNADYMHYLSLGSHQAPYQLQSVHAFSIITLHSQQKLPEQHNHELKQVSTCIVLLKGCIKIDGKTIDSSEKIGQTINNPISISNQSQQSCVFAYLAYRTTQNQSVKYSLHTTQQQPTQLSLHNSFIYIVNGKLQYLENEYLTEIKNNPKSKEPTPLLYTSTAVTVELAPNTTYLTVQQ